MDQTNEKSMKAAIMSEINRPLEIVEKKIPEAGEGKVLIKLHAAALNHRDLYIQKGLYSRIITPCVLGSDGVGIVKDTGPGVSVGMIGQRVVINPSLDWGEHEEYQSRKFRVLGMPDDGTFAEFIVVPAENIFPAPAHLSDLEAAALPLAGLTAYRALFPKGALTRGEKLFITGIGGGVALMSMQLALALDAQVFVSSSDAAKIEKAVALGAEGGVLYTRSEWHKKIQEHAGRFDLSVDGAGGTGFSKLAEIASPGGRIVNYGGTAGPIENLSPQRLFWKQLTIKGSTMGSPQDFEHLLNYVNENKIKPVIDSVFPLEKVNEAFQRMESGRHFGKIVLDISTPS